jgi:hypothetical protein
VAAVAVAGTAVYVTASAAGYNFGFKSASAPAPQASTASLSASSANTSAVCTDFVANFANALGSTPTRVDMAFQAAIAKTLKDEVANGDLTQGQADALTKKLAGKAPCSLVSNLGDNHKAAGYAKALASATASALGITPAELKKDLAGGMTLSQIAAKHNPPLNEDQFRAALIKNITPLLDKAVTDNKMTSAQEQAILQRLKTQPIPYWSTPMKKASSGASTGD